MKLNLKSILTLALSLVVMASTAGCSSSNSQENTVSEEQTVEESTVEPQEKTNINFAVLKGPTGMGAAKLMSDNDNGETANNYNITISAAPDEVTAKIINGEVDIASVPTNLAATLYNKTEGNVKMLALNTLGVLYLLEDGTQNIQSISDLSGKTVYATGQGSTPEYVIDFILKQNNVENVTVEYMKEHAELTTAMVSGQVSLGILPEPNVTTALTKNPELKISLDLTDEWQKACQNTDNKDSVLSMGCVIVRSDFLENNKDAVDTFMNEYAQSIKYVNENMEDAAKLIAQYEIVPDETMALKAIPNCNIVYIDGEEMKNSITNFFNVIFEANPKSVGGKLPNEDFYYSK